MSDVSILIRAMRRNHAADVVHVSDELFDELFDMALLRFSPSHPWPRFMGKIVMNGEKNEPPFRFES